MKWLPSDGDKDPLTDLDRLSQRIGKSADIEIPWKMVRKGSDIFVAEADFGEGRIVTLERLGLKPLNPLGKRIRVEVGEWIVALNYLGPRRFEIFSNQASVELQFRDDPITAWIRVGATEFEVAPGKPKGLFLSSGTTRILRQTTPWKDSQIEKGVTWVTFPTGEMKPWPEVGLAAGMLDALKLAYLLEYGAGSYEF